MKNYQLLRVAGGCMLSLLDLSDGGQCKGSMYDNHCILRMVSYRMVTGTNPTIGVNGFLELA